MKAIIIQIALAFAGIITIIVGVVNSNEYALKASFDFFLASVVVYAVSPSGAP